MITKDVFGVMKNGTQIDRFTLTNQSGIKVQIITYGAIVTSIQVPDRNGEISEVTLGYNDLESYLNDVAYLGAMVGRVCGRIAYAKFSLDGKQYNLSANHGEHHLHGGYKSFSKSVWKADIVETSLVMTLICADGEDGYPGELTTHLTFTLTDDNELCYDVSATCDKATPLNFTAHPYFNLGINKGENILQHTLMIHANQYLVFDDTLLPTGELKGVEGTLMDFQTPQRFADCITMANSGRGYDNCYALNFSSAGEASSSDKRLVARLEHTGSGRFLEVYTTKPALNLYTAYYAAGMTVRSGVLPQYSAVCLETQHFPDSMNHANFPSIITYPSGEYRHRCSYKFGLLKI